MRYVKTSEMEVGSRFAKPIYTKDGVLLFNSGVKADASMIEKLRSLNLYGTYILGSAEPVPPITEAELEFERFQWVETYVVDKILKDVINQKVPEELENLVNLIYSRFSNRTQRMTFNQCLRGENDFISKHSLNVAILSTLLADRMGFDQKECKFLIEAALLHDIGKLLVPGQILHKDGSLSREEMTVVYRSILQGYNVLNANYHYPAGVRRYIIQLTKELMNRLPDCPREEQKLLPGTKILQVADIYDTLTAIRSYKSPMSPFSALKVMRDEPQKYASNVVDVLEECIHILPVGSYVMLSNGEQGIVVRENSRAIDRPVVLGLMTNTLFDLSLRDTYKEVQIEDTVFTPDNRQHIEIDVSKFIN